MICVFCPEPAMDCTAPAMCEKHLDLSIICEYLRDKGEQITVEEIQRMVYICRERNGSLKLEVGDVEPMFTGQFAARYAPQPAEVEDDA